MPRFCPEERRKAQEREQKKREIVAATIPLGCREQLVEKWENREPSKALWRFIASTLIDTSNGAARDRRREQVGEMRDDAPRALEKMTESQIRALVFELALEGDLYESWGGKYTDGLREVCDLMKVDLKDLEKGARKQLARATEQADQSNQGDTGIEAQQESTAASRKDGLGGVRLRRRVSHIRGPHHKIASLYVGRDRC